MLLAQGSKHCQSERQEIQHCLEVFDWSWSGWNFGDRLFRDAEVKTQQAGFGLAGLSWRMKLRKGITIWTEEVLDLEGLNEYDDAVRQVV